jgi:hypothetical protein
MVEPGLPYAEYGLHLGFVKNDIDPQKQGRVEVVVQGLLDGGAWAEVAMAGSPCNRGDYKVPVIGTQVLVGFMKADLEQPVVLGAFAPPVLEGGIRATIPQEDLPKITFHENKDWVFIMGDLETDFPYAAIFSSRSENRIGIIMDLKANTIKIMSPESIKIQTDGVLHFEGEVIRFTVGGNERVMQRIGQPL